MVATGGILLAAAVALTAAVFALGSTPQAPLPTPAPIPALPVASWTGLVHDVGPTGLAMRSAPALDAPTASGRVADGASLTVYCAQLGAPVNEPDHTSTTWLRTDASQYVSALYLSIPGKIALPNCDPSGPELSLVAQTVAPVTAPSPAPTTARRRLTTTTTSRAPETDATSESAAPPTTTENRAPSSGSNDPYSDTDYDGDPNTSGG